MNQQIISVFVRFHVGSGIFQQKNKGENDQRRDGEQKDNNQQKNQLNQPKKQIDLNYLLL